MNIKKIVLWLLLVVVVLFFIIIVFSGDKKPSTPPQNINWAQVRANDIPTFSSEWQSSPVRIPSSDDGWEDSLFVMPDGQRIYFAYYPGDLITDFSRGNFADDLDVYYSDAPFTAKQKETRFESSTDIWSAVGPMITSEGDFFYNSNHDYLNDKESDTDVYLNDQRLPFNDDKEDSEFGNPHYCKSKDELWFDELDKTTWMLKNAKANNFEGTPELAPAPIQVSTASNFQPWLSEDCNTIYFSTNRGDIPGIVGPAIYKSTRNADDTWTTPVPVVYSKFGVGEPTLTADGKKLFYIQVFQDSETKAYTTDMFYTERK